MLASHSSSTDKLFCTGSVTPTWGARGEAATPRYERKLLYNPPRWQAANPLCRSRSFICHTQGCPSPAQRSFSLQGVTVRQTQNWSRCWEQITVECWAPNRTSVTPQSSANTARQSVRAKMGRSATKGFLWVWHGCCSQHLQQQKSLPQTGAVSIPSWRVEGLMTPLRPRNYGQVNSHWGKGTHFSEG